MNDIQAIAETMTNEFTKAVQAAARAQAATVDDIRRQYAEANAERLEGLSKVRNMREDAARLYADSLKVEEQTEAAYSARIREIDAQMDGLRMMRATRPVAVIASGERAA